MRSYAGAAFASLTSHSMQIIARHARIIAKASSFQSYSTNVHAPNLVKTCPHRQIVLEFLDHVSSMYCLKFPTSRASCDGNTLVILPSEIFLLKVTMITRTISIHCAM